MSVIADQIRRLKEELPAGVTLVAVSKFHPVESVIEAYGAGQRIFGESRPQELFAKVQTLQSQPGDSRYSDIEWHFIGHLQTNKLKLVLPYVSMVESVDSVHLLEAIDRWGRENGRVTDVLLEYHIASEDTKQGFSRQEILSLLTRRVDVPEGYAEVYGTPGCTSRQGDVPQRHAQDASCDGRRFPNVRIRGLMGMATFTSDESVVRADFGRLMSLYNEIVALRDRGLCPEIGSGFDIRSFGMTHDYRIAVEMGADMVRIGTLIFGERV